MTCRVIASASEHKSSSYNESTPGLYQAMLLIIGTIAGSEESGQPVLGAHSAQGQP